MSRHDWGLRLPPGWLDCPPYGQQIRTTQNQTFPVIASKVPLSRDWDQVVPKEYRYTPRMAVEQVTARFGVRVRMIVDLTNSHRYYNFANEFPDAERMQLAYVKVPCRGKGQTPTPESVNEVVYEMYRLLSYYQDSVVLMHCTHGFNRTGYMIVNAMARMAAGGGMAVDRCLRRFAEARPPGVYKDHYITQLFKYHHEQRPAGLHTPPVPAWKGVEGEEEEEELPPQDPAPPNAEMRHDLIEAIGEGITRLEAEHVQSQVYELITGQPPHEGRMHFPGSQPVSLARANLGLLQHQRYWVSWKADGTRYLLLVVDRGAYLVDRSFKVVRLQMRFPKPGHPPVQQHHGQAPIADYPVSRPHSLTLMDGEMVVDHAADGYHRRYLVYDMAVCNGKPLMTEKWIKRFEAVRTMVIDPRSKEQNYIQGITPRAKYMAPPLGYDYGAEPFSVRLKDFWPLYHARKVIHQMIPSLSHEADGLILQSCDSMYVANTDNALLKFKFAHLNSVDFHVKVQQRNGQEEALLMVMDTQGRRQRGPDGPPLKPIHGELERLSDPAVTLASLHDRIVECTWVPSTRCWRYLRVREDKQRPNASHVYDKVVQSIADDIREGELLDYLEAVYYHVPAYEKDRSIMQDKHRPSQLPPPPPPSDQYGRLMHQMGGGPPSPPHSHHHGRQNGGPASGPGPGPGPGRGEVDNWGHHGNSLPGPPPPLDHGPEQGGEPHPQSAPEGYVPRSPPYFGPEPTPPPSPSNGGQSPRRPHCWVAHDPATYPSEFLELPPPPQPPQPDRAFQEDYDDKRDRRHGSQPPPEYEDRQQYHRQGHGPEHSQHPAYREQLPLNPSYVDEDPGVGPPHSAAPALPVAPQRQAPPPARVVSRPVKSAKRKALGESKPSSRSQPKASAYANDFDDLNDDSGQF